MTIPRPIAFWKFDGNGDDSSGNGLHMPYAEGTFQTGVIGNSYRAGYLAVANNKRLTCPLSVYGANFTICGFVKFAAVPTGTNTVYFEQNTSGSNCSMNATHSAGGLEIEWHDELPNGNDEFYTLNSTGAVATGWHHLAIVALGSNLLLYIDGVLHDTEARTPCAQPSPAVSFSLAARPATTVELDLWYWFGSALSAEQINTLCNAGAGYEYSPPVQRSPDEFYYLMF